MIFVIWQQPLIPAVMKTKIYFLTITLLFVSLGSFAQNIDKYFESQQTVPFQKLYLHTDREFFFKGDTLWFAAYLLEGKTNKPESESCNLYVDLINSEGEIVNNELFLIQNGSGSGYLSFSDTVISEGNYLLRAYTDYLKNFGNDAFFIKTIQILSVKNSFELLEADTNKTISTQIDVSFLPEGGFLLAEESNCVAFKAVDETGKGIDISGRLFDENGLLVLTFESVYKGAGKFYFYPKPGKTYTAKIDGFQNLDFRLPDIKKTGAKIKLVNQEKKKLQMVVQTKNIARNQTFYLVCIHRNEVLFSVELDRKKTNQIIKINTKKLNGGINRFVLLDKNLNPISERLVFQEDLEMVNLDVQLNAESFSTRDEVQVNLSSDDISMDEVAQVSIAVVDENYVNASGVSQNIASYLLLDSELNGYIELPAEYFSSNKNLDSQTKLDLLMTTNGWSNYVWNELKDSSLILNFKSQFGFTFNGHVKRTFGKKALTEGSISMVIFKIDSTSVYFDKPLDLNGNFEFRNVVFYDSASVFAQARNNKDKNNIQFEMELPKLIPPDINIHSLNQLNNFSEIPISLHRQRYLNEMRLKEFYPDKNNILIGEVEVRANRSWEKWGNDLYSISDRPVLLTWENIAGATNIIDFLIYKVPRVFAKYDGGQSIAIGSPGGGTPAIVLDGFQHLTVDEARNYPINIFESIQILRPPSSYFYGSRAMFGAVVLETKSGKSLDRNLPLLGGIVKRINGFSPLREFYSPKYNAKNINSEAPDFRNTLYWNPQIIMGKGGKEAFFFTCDNISRYKIFIEGIAESGRICLGSGEFEVNKVKAE